MKQQRRQTFKRPIYLVKCASIVVTFDFCFVNTDILGIGQLSVQFFVKRQNKPLFVSTQWLQRLNDSSYRLKEPSSTLSSIYRRARRHRNVCVHSYRTEFQKRLALWIISTLGSVKSSNDSGSYCSRKALAWSCSLWYARAVYLEIVKQHEKRRSYQDWDTNQVDMFRF